MSIKKRLSQIYHSLMFNTNNPLALFFNPHYICRKEILRAVKTYQHFISGSVLDVGCGTKPYKEIIRQQQEYIGLEYGETRTQDNSSADVFYLGDQFPFESEKFNSVISFQVVEHVPDAHKFLLEKKRVLKKDGTLFFTSPLCWEEHEVPFDFRRLTRFGLRKLVEDCGFEIIELIQLGNESKVILQLIANKFHSVEKFIPSFVLKNLFRVCYCFPLNTLSLLTLTQARHLYFDNLVIAKKSDHNK